MDQNNEEISLLDLLQVVVDNLRLLILAPLFAGLLALGYSFTVTPTFTAKTTFLPPQQQASGAAAMLQSLGALGGLAGAAAGVKNPVDQYISLMQSRSVRDALVDRFNVLERNKTQSREFARNAVAGSTRISAGKDGLITIETDDKDPQFAAQMANAHVDELQRLLGRLSVTEAQQRRVFFEKQLTNAKENMVRAEQVLKTSGISSSVLKTNPQTALEGLAKLKAGITAQEVRLASMRGYLAESAPEFKQAQIELEALRGQITLSEKAQPTPGGPRGSVGNASEDDYTSKYRDYKYHETLFELFTKQYEIARIDESREGPLIQVLDVAQPPELKSKPKKVMMAVSASLYVGFSLLLFVFIRKALHGALQTPAYAGRLLKLRDALVKSIRLA
jgi:uncharacterized protein involved in exopolysaccharide biosynthesis